MGEVMTMTMRSRSILVLAMAFGAYGCSAGVPKDRPLAPERPPNEAAVGEHGWMLSGAAYDLYVVHRDPEGNRAAWLLEPAGDTFGKYATWMRHIDASDYRAKRVRVRATLKTRGASQRAELWARTEAKNAQSGGREQGGYSKKLSPDSDWTEETIVIDVPGEAAWLEYGIGIVGPGKIWLETAKLEVVNQDVPLTPP